MSHDKLRNELSGLARIAAEGFGKPKEGLVSSYDPDAGAVKVMLQPENVEAGWYPISLLMAGAGFGAYAGPAVGDQALILFAEGDSQHGICVGFLPNDEDRPPRVESGELHLIHKDGAFIKFTNDGKIKSKGAWEHDGTITATGEIKSRFGAVVASLGALWDAFLGHKHSGVQTGGSLTGTTDTTPT